MSSIITQTSEEYSLVSSYRELPRDMQYLLLKMSMTAWALNAEKESKKTESPDNKTTDNILYFNQTAQQCNHTAKRG